MKNRLPKKTAKGFSLIEMLVVIAVIGVIAAIAIPNIGNINEVASKAKAEREAAILTPPDNVGALNINHEHILMTVWNDAITHGIVEHQASRDVTQTIALVVTNPTKYGLSDEESSLLKNTPIKKFEHLSIDSATGKLVLIKPINSTTVKPGPSGERDGKNT